MDSAMASYFEQCVQAAPDISPATFANWILGEISGWVNQSGKSFSEVRVTPARLAELLRSLAGSVINQTTAKSVLAEMLESGQTAAAIIQAGGRQQISDSGFIADLVGQVLEANPQEVKSYLAGKETVANWFFGQVMRQAKGQANPQVVRAELERQLKGLKGGA
jgi:aspartyl-tRNA(Asn)/glutamyl-tRNA(Gln) amidotransferase subunit B